mgnify:CR=1 FL=1
MLLNSGKFILYLFALTVGKTWCERERERERACFVVSIGSSGV